MPVTPPRARHGRVGAAAALALCATLSTCLYAQQPDNSAALDLFVFNQHDDGGNPIQNEDLLYYGTRASAKLKISKVVSIRPTASVSILESGGKTKVPATITNATTTSASQQASTQPGGRSRYVPVTTSMGVDIKPAGWDWTFSPGVFFSYQDNYVSRGLDFSTSAELFHGNFIPSFGYGFRWDSLSSGRIGIEGIFGFDRRRREEDEDREEEDEEEEEEEEEEEGEGSGSRTADLGLKTRLTHNLQFGFTQILSPTWRLNLSFQITRQDGQLGAPNAVVTLFDGHTPVKFAKEKLPGFRDRFQLNARVRFSPALGWGLGMDNSVYVDDWGIVNVAAEPSIEGPMFPDIARWRVWYRFSYQHGTRFKRLRPQHEYTFQTDDPDLGTFNTHGGGTLLHFEVARIGRVSFAVRVSGYGWARSDHIWGYGALLGTEVGW